MWRGVKVATILVGTASAAQTVNSLGSFSEHQDIMAQGFIALAGLAYTVSTVLLVWIINKIMAHEKSLTKLETRCADMHGLDPHVHSRSTDAMNNGVVPERLAR